MPGAMLCPLSAMEKVDLSLAVVGLAGPAERMPRSRASARTGLSSLKICNGHKRIGEEGKGVGLREEEGAGRVAGREAVDSSDTPTRR